MVFVIVELKVKEIVYLWVWLETVSRRKNQDFGPTLQQNYLALFAEIQIYWQFNYKHHWKSSVEELDIDGFEKLSYNKLLELKLVPKLRILNCFGAGNSSITEEDFYEMETNLKKQMPHLIFSNYREIARNNFRHDGIWKIRAKRFQL